MPLAPHRLGLAAHSLLSVRGKKKKKPLKQGTGRFAITTFLLFFFFFGVVYNSIACENKLKLVTGSYNVNHNS